VNGLPITIVEEPGLSLAPCDARSGLCAAAGCAGGCCIDRCGSFTFADFGGRDDGALDLGGRDDRAMRLSLAPTCITGVAAIPELDASSLGGLI
jgi:hypothetical protein